MTNCDFSVFVVPAILPNEAGQDYYLDKSTGTSTYAIPKFVMDDPLCLVSTVEIDFVSGGAPSGYQSDTSVPITYVADSSSEIASIPSISILQHTYLFRFKATCSYGQIAYSDNIKILKVNCDYMVVSIPTILPVTSPYDYLDLIEPLSPYVIPKFTVDNTFCHLTSLSLVAATSAAI